MLIVSKLFIEILGSGMLEFIKFEINGLIDLFKGFNKVFKKY